MGLPLSRVGETMVAWKEEELATLRDGLKINWVFWRGEDKAAKEGEADILLIRRCSLTPAAAARQDAEVIFEPSLKEKHGDARRDQCAVEWLSSDALLTTSKIVHKVRITGYLIWFHAKLLDNDGT